MEPITNETTKMVPRVSFEGPALEFDFPSMHIGVAEYEEGPTGCTVFYFPEGALTVSDIRGGSSATISAGDGLTHAICFAGGSFYGLEAVTGVAAELFAKRGYSTRWRDIAIVRGAVIYDYASRSNAIYPDKSLGRAALQSARTGIFPLGPRGAGRSTTVGKGLGLDQGESAGQGGAFRQLGSIKIGVFTVVNAVGAVVDRKGQVVRGHLDRATGRRHHFHECLEHALANREGTESHFGNTTLTVVVTNQKLDIPSLRQLARQVHSSMARAIQPFHTIYDGDVLYAVTTNEVVDPVLNLTALGAIASELAWDAVMSCFSESP
jgi:L-aminopeptidase/D-esterase-like protein